MSASILSGFLCVTIIRYKGLNKKSALNERLNFLEQIGAFAHKPGCVYRNNYGELAAHNDVGYSFLLHSGIAEQSPPKHYKKNVS